MRERDLSCIQLTEIKFLNSVQGLVKLDKVSKRAIFYLFIKSANSVVQRMPGIIVLKKVTLFRDYVYGYTLITRFIGDDSTRTMIKYTKFRLLFDS